MAALLRRTRNLSLRQLRLLHSVATGGLGCAPLLLESAASGGGLPPAGARPTQLWLYDSPLLRHLSTAAVQDAEATAPASYLLPPYERLKAQAATAANRGGSGSGEAQAALALQPGERSHVARVLRNFQHSGAVKSQALALYVNDKLYREAVPRFQEWLVAAMDAELRDALLGLQPGEAAQEALFPYFAQWVLETYTDDIKAYRNMIQTVDLRNPHQWFPMARALQRRIVYHAGPTNSGKTYNALQAMRAAQSGIYCGPLRLLAMEVYDTCNADGLYCNLITGQERRAVPGAQHTACTVEMVNMQQRVDVAVIDEIQMIGDANRGWAWTRALMGVPANEVHLCGDGSAVPLVRQICEEMGEIFELNTYDRFTTLSVEEEGLAGGYGGVQPGDCVVAFSRKDIYTIKQYIEQETKHRACVVYGALPPETRRQQAKLFNEPDNAYRVMVASDAVGMGLNLNIRRVIFHSVTKREGGKRSVPVSVSMIKQIAGRAGRRSSQWPEGLATCRNPADVAKLQEALAVPLDQLTCPSAGLFPEFEHFEVFAGQRPDEPYSSLLTAFEREALLDSSYFFCKQDSVVAAAQMLGQLGLSVRDMYTFSMAPASASDLRLSAALLQFATKYSKGLPVALDISVPNRVPSSTEELRHMEAAHQVVMLWLWLSYRFDADVFPQRDKVQAQAELICGLLDKGLKRLTRMSKSGIDIADRPSRPEHEGILKCFADELDLLESQRRQQRQASRREERREERRAAALERSEALLAALALPTEEEEGEAIGEAQAGAGAAPADPVAAAQERPQGRQRAAGRQRKQQAEDAAETQPQEVPPGKHRHQQKVLQQRQLLALVQQEQQAQRARPQRTLEQQQASEQRRERRKELRRQLQAKRQEERQQRMLAARQAILGGEDDAAQSSNRAHASKAHLSGAATEAAIGVVGSGGMQGAAVQQASGWRRLLGLFS